MSLSPQAFPRAPEVRIRKIQGRIKIANEKYAKRRLNHMYSQVFIMSTMSSWRNRWLFLLSIFCLDNVRTPFPECVKTSPPGKLTSRPVHWVKSHFPSFTYLCVKRLS